MEPQPPYVVPSFDVPSPVPSFDVPSPVVPSIGDPLPVVPSIESPLHVVPNYVPRPRVLLAACGCKDAIKFGTLCQYFCGWAVVRAIATDAAVNFINNNTIPDDVSFVLPTEEFTELRNWADIIVVAPLSANTMAKIAVGLCDNVLTCIIKSWDYSKPSYIAPAMHPSMWSSPSTQKHIVAVEELGMKLLPPVFDQFSDGEVDTWAMAEPLFINTYVRDEYQQQHG